MADLLALDFDGVLCDGLPEYFRSAWRAGQRVWGWGDTPPADLEAAFGRLRPWIETGWEMPLALWALQTVGEIGIGPHWPSAIPPLLEQCGCDRTTLTQALDQVRSDWIATDRSGWLALHRFYPGVLEALRAWGDRWCIVTTKDGRFTHELLTQAGLECDRRRIFGKEVGQPKPETLKQLQAQGYRLTFVEDRAEALLAAAQQPELTAVRLVLADWGYNTAAQRQQALTDIPGVELLRLADFPGLLQPASSQTT